jgi:hypothetical protein
MTGNQEGGRSAGEAGRHSSGGAAWNYGGYQIVWHGNQ